MSEMTKPALSSAWRAGRESGRGMAGPANRAQNPYSTKPVALQVFKRGRWCTVAKLTHFEGESQPVLGVCWRSQAGTREALSLPVAVLDYARRHGVRRFFLRDDRRMTMWTSDLNLFERGRLGRDGERYIPIAWLQECPWRPWAFAEEVVTLEAEPPSVQLRLFGEAGA